MMKENRISVQGITPGTIDEFKKFVMRKHGKLHTVYAQELEKAIIMYLADQAKPVKPVVHTHSKPDVSKPSKSGSKAKFEVVKQRFLTDTNDTDEFQQFYAKRLVQQGMGVYDPRVVERYCTKLFDAWLLGL